MYWKFIQLSNDVMDWIVISAMPLIIIWLYLEITTKIFSVGRNNTETITFYEDITKESHWTL